MGLYNQFIHLDKKTKFLVFFVLGVICYFIFRVYIVFTPNVQTNPLIQKNNEEFIRNLYNLDMTMESGVSIYMPKIATFDYDYIYSFARGMSKQEIEDILGFKSSYIETTKTDTEEHVIFIKDNQIVASFVGPRNKINVDFNISTDDETSKYVCIARNEDIQFNVYDEKGVYTLYAYVYRLEEEY